MLRPTPRERAAWRRVAVRPQRGLDVARLRLGAESPSKQGIAYKDTATYFGIHLGKVTQWILRAWCSGAKKALVTRVPVEQTRLLAHGFEVDAPSENVGASRVYFAAIKDVEKLRPLVLMAYEEQVKRMRAGV